ncbi:MAG: 16S rRNA (cytosine(1402)-N(4))-methyltransferase RsmH [Clostridia bacterium]|nr:16S rRNA (cytosine(1402)-N(4))-methyltransferase RsmH [Clostridia bacterium]
MAFQHTPVLLQECLTGLQVRPDGVYLDGTLGGGGHAAAVLGRLTTGRLIGIDRDDEAIAAASARLRALQRDGLPAFSALHGNFHDAKALLAEIGVDRVDGALLDLGVSSHQFDTGERGFSYQEDAPLDMRMDRSQRLTAAMIVNTWPQDEISRILTDYGEESWAAHIARVICDRRRSTPIETTGQLVSLIDAAIPKKIRLKDTSHPARKTFQALRIAVNDELAPLEKALRDLVDLLNPGGRLCVIAFHSLEDRIVKNTFRNMADPCTCPPSFPVCVCGKKPLIRLVTRKPITPSEDELKANNRARSATLRVAERLSGDAV